MTSPTEMCNRALTLLGQGRISDIDNPDDDKAVVCKTHYEPLFMEVLTLHTWRDFTKTAKLEGGVEPVNKWPYAFRLPADLLIGPDVVYNSSQPHPDRVFDWQVYGRDVHTKWQEIWIDYRWRAPEGQWRPHFQSLITYALAARLAKPITESTSMAAHWWGVAFGRQEEGMMGGFCRTARGIDSKTTVQDAIDSSEIMAARLGAGALPGRSS